MRGTSIVIALLLLAATAAAKERPKRAPKNARGDGKVYSYQAKDGLAFEYCVPKSYDPKKGTTLLVSFHGSNLGKGWTFWNHKAGQFCRDRIIVSPDGTTPNGKGGYNFLDGDKDMKRVHALIEEIRKTFNVTQTFLYGHSQGSFFIQHLVARYPDLADGICAHASGVWSHTRIGRAGHDIAIGILHGSRDPVVPYGQSRGSNKAYRDAKYPLVSFYTWFLGNHWPAAYHAERVIAWCEGMTTDSPERVTAVLETLADVKEPGAGHWASLWQVANRAREMRGVANGAALADAVDALAQSHVDALTPRIEKGEPGPWVIHFQRFLVDFEGVPARDAFAEKHAKLFKKHQSAAVSGFRKYYRKRAKDPAEAFAGGVEGFSKGFLHWECDDVFSGLEAMAKKGKKLKIHPKVLSAYKKKVAWYAKAVAKGNKEYVKVNRSAKLK